MRNTKKIQRNTRFPKWKGNMPYLKDFYGSKETIASTATANTCRTKHDHKKIYNKEMPINITNNPSLFVLIERCST